MIIMFYFSVAGEKVERKEAKGLFTGLIKGH